MAEYQIQLTAKDIEERLMKVPQLEEAIENIETSNIIETKNADINGNIELKHISANQPLGIFDHIIPAGTRQWGYNIVSDKNGENLYGGESLMNALVDMVEAGVDAEKQCIHFATKRAARQVTLFEFDENKQYAIVMKGYNSKKTSATSIASLIGVKYSDNTIIKNTFNGTPEDQDYVSTWSITITDSEKTPVCLQTTGGTGVSYIEYNNFGVFDISIAQGKDFETFFYNNMLTEDDNLKDIYHHIGTSHWHYYDKLVANEATSNDSFDIQTAPAITEDGIFNWTNGQLVFNEKTLNFNYKTIKAFEGDSIIHFYPRQVKLVTLFIPYIDTTLSITGAAAEASATSEQLDFRSKGLSSVIPITSAGWKRMAILIRANSGIVDAYIGNSKTCLQNLQFGYSMHTDLPSIKLMDQNNNVTDDTSAVRKEYKDLRGRPYLWQLVNHFAGENHEQASVQKKAYIDEIRISYPKGWDEHPDAPATSDYANPVNAYIDIHVLADPGYDWDNNSTSFTFNLEGYTWNHRVEPIKTEINCEEPVIGMFGEECYTYNLRLVPHTAFNIPGVSKIDNLVVNNNYKIQNYNYDLINDTFIPGKAPITQLNSLEIEGSNNNLFISIFNKNMIRDIAARNYNVGGKYPIKRLENGVYYFESADNTNGSATSFLLEQVYTTGATNYKAASPIILKANQTYYLKDAEIYCMPLSDYEHYNVSYSSQTSFNACTTENIVTIPAINEDRVVLLARIFIPAKTDFSQVALYPQLCHRKEDIIIIPRKTESIDMAKLYKTSNVTYSPNWCYNFSQTQDGDYDYQLLIDFNKKTLTEIIDPYNSDSIYEIINHNIKSHNIFNMDFSQISDIQIYDANKNINNILYAKTNLEIGVPLTEIFNLEITSENWEKNTLDDGYYYYSKIFEAPNVLISDYLDAKLDTTDLRKALSVRKTEWIKIIDIIPQNGQIKVISEEPIETAFTLEMKVNR